MPCPEYESLFILRCSNSQQRRECLFERIGEKIVIMLVCRIGKLTNAELICLSKFTQSHLNLVRFLLLRIPFLDFITLQKTNFVQALILQRIWYEQISLCSQLNIMELQHNRFRLFWLIVFKNAFPSLVTLELFFKTAGKLRNLPESLWVKKQQGVRKSICVEEERKEVKKAREKIKSKPVKKKKKNLNHFTPSKAINAARIY